MSIKQKAIIMILLGMACAIGGFVMLFTAFFNNAISLGLAILLFVGFWKLFDHGWKMLDAGKTPDNGAPL